MPPPTLKRRLGSMLYEAVLLSGVLIVAGALFSLVFGQHPAPYLRHFMQLWLLCVLGVYFIWFWMHGGQTLPMKVWRVQVVNDNGGTVPFRRAAIRFFLAWLWFLPALALASLLKSTGWMLVGIISTNILVWILFARLHANKQFLHDHLAGTRLIQLPEN